MNKILVVDDAELNRELLYDILKDDYIIETAQDGFQALTMLRKHASEISALLLDLRMPKLDGFAVIEEMRQNLSAYSFVFICTLFVYSSGRIISSAELN